MSPNLKTLEDYEAFIAETFPVLHLAMFYHVTHKGDRLTFNDHKYLKQIYKDPHPVKAIIKSTQCGISEYLMQLAISKAKNGRDVFYVFPNWGLSSRFIKNRYDKSILKTDYYQDLVMNAQKRKAGFGYMGAAESMSLKNIGSGTIAMIGSQSSSAFTEFPADDLIIDELDECVQDNIEMGEERLGHAKDPSITRVANPTIEGYGIDLHYANSDKNEWFLQCEHCGKWFTPDFFRNVVRQVDTMDYVVRDETFDWEKPDDAKLICEECDKPVNRFSSGEWVPTGDGRDRGYHISKLFSSRWPIRNIVERFQRGLYDDVTMQRVYNGDLGLAYNAPGSRITRGLIDDAKGEYMVYQRFDRPGIMGVDVGKVLHVTIAALGEDGRLYLEYADTVQGEEDVIKLWNEYRVRVGVIDAAPETRMSRRLVKRFKGMFMCYQGNAKRDSVDQKRKIVSVDRTTQLDTLKEKVVMKDLVFPANIDSVPEFYDQMGAATRFFDEKRDEYIWNEGSKADHYMHAAAFMVTARQVAAAVSI